MPGKQDPRPPEVLRPSEVFGRQLEGVRRRKGWTQQRLADEMTALRGKPMRQSAVANIETGKRQAIPIGEVFEFALALGVPPTALLVPREDDVRMQFGETSVSGAEILEWFRGFAPLPGNVVDRTFYDERPDSEAAAVREYPNLLKVMFAVSKALTLSAEYGPQADETRAAVESLERLITSGRPT